jgi:hypothetical protein
MASQERMQAKVGEDARRLEGGVPFLVTTMSNKHNRLDICKRPVVGALLYMCSNAKYTEGKKEEKLS